MNILFVSFGELSLAGGTIRSVAVLRTLADLGCDIDVVAARTDIASQAQAQVNILVGGENQPLSKKGLRKAVRQALRHNSYDVVHAVDEAVLFVSRATRWRRVKVVYDASRCFTGPHGIAPSRLWKFFPDRHLRTEKKILHGSTVVLSSCSALTLDLKNLATHARVVQIEDVPVHPLMARREIDRKTLIGRFTVKTSFILVCSFLPDSRNDFRKFLLAARKVIERVPDTVFFFKGIPAEEGLRMTSSLDISEHCIFLPEDKPEEFIAVLSNADAVLFVPKHGNRYIHAEIYTLLNSPAIVVAIKEAAYGNLLTEWNSIEVLSSTSSISEGLLRVIQEPLLSIGIATDGQQLIVDKYTLSSFKHKIRMVYHDVEKSSQGSRVPNKVYR